MISKGKLRTYILGYMLILPSFIFLFGFTYFPVVRSFYLSLWQRGRGGVRVFAGIANYVDLYADPIFRVVLRNNLVFAAATVIPTIVLGLILALLLIKPIKGRGFFRFAFL